MDATLILEMLVILEVVWIEFCSVWKLSRRKMSLAASAAWYGGITALVMVLVWLVFSKASSFGSGSGEFMYLGVVYFIPVLVCFGGDIRSRLIVAFYSFSYGLACFGLAVRLAYLLPEEHFTLGALLIQTAVMLASWRLYLHFSSRRVIPAVMRATAHQRNMLIRYTIASFVLIINFNQLSTLESTAWHKLLIYALLVYFIVLSYRLLTSYLEAERGQQELTRQIRLDGLTGLENRQALYAEMDSRIRAQETFRLLFMDLDSFKQINDTYGHSAGDQYLCAFAQALRGMQTANTRCYRVSGDEFACITTDPALAKRLRHLKPTGMPEGRFLGVSVGEALYPDDGDTLVAVMERADEKMYQMKQHNPRSRI